MDCAAQYNRHRLSPRYWSERAEKVIAIDEVRYRSAGCNIPAVKTEWLPGRMFLNFFNESLCSSFRCPPPARIGFGSRLRLSKP